MSLVAGLLAVINGALNLAFAKGGSGSGNGVVGGAVALVLALVAMAPVGWLWAIPPNRLMDAGLPASKV